MSDLKHHIADVPDFPSSGIMFRDISPLLAERFSETIAQLVDLYEPAFWDGICTVVGIDARGFIFASALAAMQQKRLALVRKPGKLPPPVVSLDYTLEYGSGSLEMKQGSGNVLIVDDVLATGGTLRASADLCRMAGYEVRGFATVIDLKYLNDFTWQGITARCLVVYND